MGKIGLFIVLLFFASGYLDAAPSRVSIPLEYKLEFRWGDLSPEQRKLEIDSPGRTAFKWHPVPHPTVWMDEDRKQDIIWLRFRVPETNIVSPVLYIARIYDCYQVFLDHELLREFGHPFQEDPPFSFEGHEHIVIPIPEDHAGKYVYIRLFSSYKGIGFQDIFFGSFSSQIKYILLNDVGRLSAVFILFCLFLFCLLFLIQVRGNKARALLGLSGLLFASALFPLLESQTHYLIYNDTRFWFLFGQVTTPLQVALVYFYEKVFGEGWKKVIRRLWQFHLVTAVISISLVLSFYPMGWLTIRDLQGIIDGYLSVLGTIGILLDCLVISVATVMSLRRGDSKARWFAVGSGLLLISAVPDVMRTVGEVFVESHIHWGMLGFVICLGFIVEQIQNESVEKVNEFARDLAQAESSLSEAKLKTLQDRMSPHFLFNSLNAIHALLHFDVASARSAVGVLAENYRFLLQHANKPLIPFHREWEFVDNYLQLQRLRFGNNLEIRFEMDDALEEILIPPLTLQPLVENAFKHGLRKRTGAGLIEVEARAYLDGILLEVRDNGVGLKASPEKIKLRSLENIQHRLGFHYAEADFQISNQLEQDGVTVIIRFHKLKENRSVSGQSLSAAGA